MSKQTSIDGHAVVAEESILLAPDAVVVQGVRFTDPRVVSFLRSVGERERVAAFTRAVSVGVVCLENTQTSLNVDLVLRQVDVVVERVVDSILGAVGRPQDAGLAEGLRKTVHEEMGLQREEFVRIMAPFMHQLGFREAEENSPSKGIPFEVQVYGELKALEVSSGAQVVRVGDQPTKGDILLLIPSLGRPGQKDRIIIEVKNSRTPMGRRKLRAATQETMDAHDAVACIWVNKQEGGFCSDVGHYAASDNARGPWVATVHPHLPQAIYHVQMLLHLAHLQRTQPQVNTAGFEAVLHRVEDAMKRRAAIHKHFAAVRTACNGAESQVRLMDEEVMTALQDAWVCLHARPPAAGLGDSNGDGSPGS